jgi:hypothetical protein
MKFQIFIETKYIINPYYYYIETKTNCYQTSWIKKTKQKERYQVNGERL